MLSFFEKTIIAFDLFVKLLTFEKLLIAEKFLIFRELLTLFECFNKVIIAFDVFNNKKVDAIIDLNIIKILL